MKKHNKKHKHLSRSSVINDIICKVWAVLHILSVESRLQFGSGSGGLWCHLSYGIIHFCCDGQLNFCFFLSVEEFRQSLLYNHIKQHGRHNVIQDTMPFRTNYRDNCLQLPLLLPTMDLYDPIKFHTMPSLL